MNIQQEIQDCKCRISKYQNKINYCSNDEQRNHYAYQLKQEQIKLEGFELLLELSQKVGGNY